MKQATSWLKLLAPLTELQQEQHCFGGDPSDRVSQFVHQLGEKCLLLLWLLVEKVKDVPHHLLSNVHHRVKREPLSVIQLLSKWNESIDVNVSSFPDQAQILSSSCAWRDKLREQLGNKANVS